MRNRVSLVSLLAAGFVAGYFAGERPPARAQVEQVRLRKCVGLSTAVNNGWTHVYRAFDDGTVERRIDSGRPKSEPWEELRK